MHASSLENMAMCVGMYLAPVQPQPTGALVLDVGGAPVNGSYQSLFPEDRYEYITADIDGDADVDVHLDDQYMLPFEDGTVDVVISGQTFEHCEAFWLLFAEMVRVMSPTGIMFLIAPSAGPIHRHPVDCYRFYPDAYSALAKSSKCELLDIWLDERGPWRDLVGVFCHEGSRRTRVDVSDLDPKHLMAGAPPRTHEPGLPETEVVNGDVSYLRLLDQCHGFLEPRHYLEIGVDTGRSLALAQGPATGIDPEPEISVELGDQTEVITTTSDLFFRAETHTDDQTDLVFIDGLHLAEYGLRDFMNAERRCDATGLIVFDDVLPNHPAQASRERITSAWTGDIWLVERILRRHRPDLFLLTVDTKPSGLLFVAGLDPSSTTLWEAYNPIIRRTIYNHDGSVPNSILNRTEAVAADHVIVGELLQTLRDLRDREADVDTVRTALSSLRDRYPETESLRERKS